MSENIKSRKTRTGSVVSNRMEKSVVVRVERHGGKACDEHDLQIGVKLGRLARQLDHPGYRVWLLDTQQKVDQVGV